MLAHRDRWAFAPVCHILFPMHCVNCIRWSAPTSRGVPALPADPALLPQGSPRQCDSRWAADSSRWEEEPSTQHARAGDCNSWVVLGQTFCVCALPVHSPAFSATLREISKVFKVSGSQEEPESRVGAQRCTSMRSLVRSAPWDWDGESCSCKAIRTLVLFLGHLWLWIILCVNTDLKGLFSLLPDSENVQEKKAGWTNVEKLTMNYKYLLLTEW